MTTTIKKFNNIDEYIAGFPKETQKILEQIRTEIKKAAPEASETIKGDETFKNEIAVYKGAKSSVRFPIDKPIPLELISRIVKFRIIENKEKSIDYK